MDRSNGYEEYAEEFIRRREVKIGTAEVGAWAAQFKPGAEVLELGCGHGVISRVLLDAGVSLFAVDASPTLLHALQERFPAVVTQCAAAEDSDFFGRTFDGIASWGLLFLLDEDAQRKVLSKAAQVLRPGGRLLFTAPQETGGWIDVTTRLPSRSLGLAAYENILQGNGLHVTSGVTDAGDNHYYFAEKPK